MTSTLKGMVSGENKANLLEQARGKLLYGPIPRGISTRTELKRRFDRWEEGSFSDLLVQAEV